MLRYKLSAKIMFFFEIMAITKEKMLSLPKNSRNQAKREKN